MTEGKKRQKKATGRENNELKTYSVPLASKKSQEDISITSENLSKPFNQKIINQALHYHSKGNILEAAKLYHYFINQGLKEYRIFANYGVILKDLGKLKEAELLILKAIEMKPDLAEAHCNLGSILTDMGRLKEAELSLLKAIELKPDFAIAYSNLGSLLRDMGRLKEAELSERKAIELKPDFANAHTNLSLILLKRKNFKEGWDHFEWRWKSQTAQKLLGKKLKTSKPKWTLESKGRVLLWVEQGIGEEVLFASLIPELVEKVDKLIVKVDKRLIKLFQRSFNPDIVYIDKNYDLNEDDYDFQIPIGSLAKLFRNTNESFKKSKKQYLKANDVNTRIYLKKLKDINKLRFSKIIGISWRSTSKVNDKKSLSLEEFILGIYSPGICFVNLQYGDTKDEIHDIKIKYGINIYEIEDVDNFHNLDGLSSIINACDEVVSIENITLFLAGGLGIKSWILLTKDCIWYNGSTELKSDWYPSLNFVRQRNYGEWSSELKQIRKRIQIK